MRDQQQSYTKRDMASSVPDEAGRYHKSQRNNDNQQRGDMLRLGYEFVGRINYLLLRSRSGHVSKMEE